MSILRSKHSGWTWEGKRTPFGGSGGGSPGPSTTYSQTSNIPDYARPYVENMLQSTQAQIYNDDMTGFRPYTPYSTDVNDYFAGFSPLQQQAQQSAWNLQTPEEFGVGSALAGQAGLGGLAAQQNADYLGQQAMGYGQAGSIYGDTGAQYGLEAGNRAQQAAQMYGAQGAGYGSQAAGLAGQAQNYGQTAANLGMQGTGYGSQGAGYGAQAAAAAQKGFEAQQAYEAKATSPEAQRAFMSPYMQNVVDYQKTQALRDFQIGQGARQASAVAKGAFGGSRQAIENAEAQRNLMSQLQGIEATGAQEAFKNAQAQQQFGANLGIQGLQAGYGGLQAGMQGAGVGLQGLGTAMQGQQAGLQGLGQANQLYQTGIQGSQAGLQGVGQQIAGGQLGLAGTAQGMQGAQVGLQGVQGAVGAGQYGLSGLGLANQSAATLGQLGTQRLAADTSIIGTQAQMGREQQALEQQKINQAIQDYAIQQQYPMMQLGLMSNMLRGLPMQAQTTQMYQAQPSALQQGIGLFGAGASLYGAGRAAGGEIKEMAQGGLTGYKYGGAIPGPKLEGMADKLDLPQLQALLKDPQLDRGEREIIEDALNDKTRARSKGIAAAGGGLFNTMGYAGGGILAFAGEDGSDVKDPEKLAEQINLIGAQLDAINKEAGGRTAPGSKQRAFAPEKVAEFENLKKRQSELQSEYSDLMGKAGLDKPAIGYRSGVAPTTLYPNNTEQALLGTKPPEAKAMPTEGELKAFDEATQRYLAEQKAGKGAAGPTGGAEGSRAYGVPSGGGVGTGAGSTLGGILANLRKEGPQGEFGADRLADLAKFEAGREKRFNTAKDIAAARGFLKFGSTPAPGGIGQAAVAGLGEYTEGYAKALESDEKYRDELSKQKQDVLALQRAEERGDVKLAAELQDKIADRANRLQAAQISASAAGQTQRAEQAKIERLMKENPGMTYKDALQFVAGAGRMESNDITALKNAIELKQKGLYAPGVTKEDRARMQQEIAQLQQRLVTIGMSGLAATGGAPTGGKVDTSNPLLKG